MKMNGGKFLLLVLCYLVGLFFVADIIYTYCAGNCLTAPFQELILDVGAYQDSQMDSVWSILKHRATMQPFNVVAFVIFFMAICHTFFSYKFHLLSENLVEQHIKEKSTIETFGVEVMRFMGEVEVVFGVWVIPLLILMTFYYDWPSAINYLEGRSYTEPLFVVVIMALASTSPIINLAENCLRFFARLGGESVKAWWWAILTLAPLAGSFITEPGAMTIGALLLAKQFYILKPNPKFAYATLGLLFTNISVGGVLTNFAAPPVLMVSNSWGWSSQFMLTHFGLKALLGIIIANALYFLLFQKEFSRLENVKKDSQFDHQEDKTIHIPFWISLVHVIFMAWIVAHVEHPVIFFGSFLLFLGFYRATYPFQKEMTLKTPILVGFFLAGLVVHGSLQAWWIEPLIRNASSEILMSLSIFLTSFNDNAEVTFLASLIPSLTDAMKYSIVAGAVTGGGLTVIANAPNPSGQVILSPYFEHGISPLRLFLGALLPTATMAAAFYFFQL